jgi:hypothetical protein
MNDADPNPADPGGTHRGAHRTTCPTTHPRRRLLQAFPALALAGLASRAGAQPAAASGPAASSNVDVGGVRFAPTVNVGGSTLQLNGAGLRLRFVVRVYAAGLYLADRASTPEAVLALPGPKRLHVVMQRDIDANELGRLFTRGMQANTPREMFARSTPGTLRIGEIFAARKRLRQGDSFSVDFVPGQGTLVRVNDEPQGAPIAEPEFFSALLLIWLGPQPADAALKDALLGRTPAPPPGGGVSGRN